MGQRVTIAMQGTLQLSLDGSPSRRPVNVMIPDMQLDLDFLMREGHLKLRDDGKAEIALPALTFTLFIDADEILQKGADAIVVGLERELQ